MTDLPPGWEWTSIGEVAEINPAMPKSDLADDRIVSFVPMAAVSEESGAVDVSDTRPASVLKGKSYRQFADDDLLVAKITPSMENGKAAVVRGLTGGRGFGSTEFHVVRTSGVVLPDYLLHFVLQRSFRADAARNMKGTAGQLRVPPDYLRYCSLPLPPRAEQYRIIAAIEEHLSRLAAAEALLAAAKERVDVLARVSARTLFDSQSWRWTTLGEVAAIKGGVTKDSKRQSDPAFVEVPYLRVANVQRGRLDLDEVTTIRVHPDQAKALRLETGDVLLNEGGDRDKLGRGWVWEGQIEGCIHQNHVFRARLNHHFDPYFVSTHANTWGQAWFEKHGRQTTNLASINLGTLKQLPVPAPSRAEQELIVAELRRSEEAQRRLIESINHAQRRAASLRRSILAAAFSGKLVPQDPDDEPPSALLDRIRAERAAVTPIRRTRKAKAS